MKPSLLLVWSLCLGACQTAPVADPNAVTSAVQNVMLAAEADPAEAQRDDQRERAKAASRDIKACAVEAFSTETDPAGLNVRAGPGKQFPTVGVLHSLIDIEPENHDGPPEPGGEIFGPGFNIVAISGAWLKIDDIDPAIEGFEAGGTTLVVRKNYQGTGWVHRSKAAVDPGFYEHAYDKPYLAPGRWKAIDKNAGDLLTLTGGKQGYTAQLLSCHQNWLEIRYDREGRKHLGWFKMRPHYVGVKYCRNEDPDCPARQNLEIWE